MFLMQELLGTRGYEVVTVRMRLRRKAKFGANSLT